MHLFTATTEQEADWSQLDAYGGDVRVEVVSKHTGWGELEVTGGWALGGKGSKPSQPLELRPYLLPWVPPS